MTRRVLRFRRPWVLFIVAIVGLELLLRALGGFVAWRAAQQLGKNIGNGPLILAVGESTTAGLGVRPPESYPRLLQQKLRDYYGLPAITVVAPWAMGQNSSQQLNRISKYLETYEPRLVLLMCGVNNPWSFAESNIAKFVDEDDSVLQQIRLRLFLDRFRLVKLLRLGAIDLKYVIDDLEGKPETEKWPPTSEVFDWSKERRPAFRELWRSDVGQMIDISAKAGAKVTLMTYPTYKFPSPADFCVLADQYGIPLIDIHQAFAECLETGKSSDILLDDGYHPNPRGYELLADRVFRFIIENDALGLISSAPSQGADEMDSGDGRCGGAETDATR